MARAPNRKLGGGDEGLMRLLAGFGDQDAGGQSSGLGGGFSFNAALETIARVAQNISGSGSVSGGGFTRPGGFGGGSEVDTGVIE